MQSEETIGIAFVLLLVLSLSANLPPDSNTHDAAYVSPAANTLQLVPNPNLTTEPNMTNVGTSGEFSSGWNSTSNSADLVWTHVAGTPLNWASKGFGWPDCLDHVRLTENAFWAENRQPDGLRAAMVARLEVTGDFATEEDGRQMFECTVYVKTTESPSDWYPILHFPTDSEGSVTKSQELPQGSITYAWDNVLEDCFDENGEPVSGFHILIALSPTYRFEQWVDYEPWLHYNGQVKLTVDSFQVEALLSEAIPIGQVPSPTTTEVLSTTQGHLFCKGLAETTSGMRFGLANLQPRSWYQPSDTHSHVLVNLDQRNLEDPWNGNGSAVALALVSDSQDLLTAGITRNTSSYLYAHQGFLAKWSEEGEQEWVAYWGDYYDALEIDIAVSHDHSIYVAGVFYLEVGELIFTMRSELLKFSENGTHQWTVISEEWYLPWWHGIELGHSIALSNETIFTLEPNRLSSWYLNGSQRWNLTTPATRCFHDVMVDSTGGLFTTSANATHLHVEKWTSSGESKKRITMEVVYQGEWYEFLECKATCLTDSGSLIVLAETYRYDSVKVLFKTDLNLTGSVSSQLNQGGERTPMLPCSILVMGNDELVCLCSEDNGTRVNLVLKTFLLSRIFREGANPILFIAYGIGIGSVAAGVLVAVVFIRRRGGGPSP